MKHRNSTSLAFVRGIHRWPVNSPHKRPETRKMYSFDDVIMDCKSSAIDKVKIELEISYFVGRTYNNLSTACCMILWSKFKSTQHYDIVSKLFFEKMHTLVSESMFLLKIKQAGACNEISYVFLSYPIRTQQGHPGGCHHKRMLIPYLRSNLLHSTVNTHNSQAITCQRERDMGQRPWVQMVIYVILLLLLYPMNNMLRWIMP